MFVPPHTPEVPASRSRCLGWLAGGMLGLATLAVYWPATQCGFINYDDPVYVTSNLQVQQGLTFASVARAFSEIVCANWHPLTMLSHTLDFQLFGLNPWGHHLSSILFHSLNTILVFVLLKRLTGALWPSWFVAALFGLSPLRVESVVWVAERKDVLSGFFGLLSLIFYARYAQGRVGPGRNPPQPQAQPTLALNARSPARDYGLALFFLALGLMSKPMLVTWPCVMLLLDYWPLQQLNASSFWRLLREKIPFFALALAGSIVTYLTQKHEGAVQILDNLSLYQRGENAVISYAQYLAKLLWPSDLAVLYPLPQSYPLLTVVVAGAVMVIVSLIVWSGRRRRPYLLMGWLWYCGMLVPVIGLVQVGSQAMADRYTYLPSVGFWILTVWGMAELAAQRRHHLVLLLVLGTADLSGRAVQTRHQIAYWRDSETLFRQTVAVTRGNYYAYNNLGVALFNEGKVDAAIRQYQRALQIKPAYAECHNNLGAALDQKGLIGEAVQEYETAARLKPDAADIQHILGADLVKLGRCEEAIGHLRQALRLRPDDASTLNDLGNALDSHGQTEEAIREYRAAIQLQPDNAQAHSNLGAAYGKQGNLDGAVRELETAVRLQADDPLTRYNFGAALTQKGRPHEAILQLREALRLNPGFVEASNLIQEAEAEARKSAR